MLSHIWFGAVVKELTFLDLGKQRRLSLSWLLHKPVLKGAAHCLSRKRSTSFIMSHFLLEE
jgi:hypothetical protein